MEVLKDPSQVLEVERLVYHAERPGFRIAELHLSSDQKVPWHYHTNVQDTFYVLQGGLRIFLRDPERRDPPRTWRDVRRSAAPAPSGDQCRERCCGVSGLAGR